MDTDEENHDSTSEEETECVDENSADAEVKLASSSLFGCVFTLCFHGD